MKDQNLKDLYLKHPGIFIKGETSLTSDLTAVSVHLLILDGIPEYRVQLPNYNYGLWFLTFEAAMVVYHRLVNCGCSSVEELTYGLHYDRTGSWYLPC